MCIYYIEKKQHEVRRVRRVRRVRWVKESAQKCKLVCAAAFRGFSLVKKTAVLIVARTMVHCGVRFVSYCCRVTTSTTARNVCLEGRRMVFLRRVVQKTVVHLNTCAIRPYCVRIVSRFSSILRRYDRDPFFYARTYAVVSKFLYIIFFVNFFVIFIIRQIWLYIILPYSIESFICPFLGVLTAFVSLLV